MLCRGCVCGSARGSQEHNIVFTESGFPWPPDLTVIGQQLQLKNLTAREKEILYLAGLGGALLYGHQVRGLVPLHSPHFHLHRLQQDRAAPVGYVDCR